MFGLSQPDQATIQIRLLSRVLRNTRVTLPEGDYQRLQEHLDDCECALRPSSRALAYVLANKLMNTRPMSDVNCAGLVVGGSRVTYAVDDEAPETGLLVHRARAGTLSGVIPVASLLGATLIGMRVGQRVPLPREDGTIGRLSVIDVTGAPQIVCQPPNS